MILEHEDWRNEFKPIEYDEDASWGGCYIDHGRQTDTKLLEVMAAHLGKSDELTRLLEGGELTEARYGAICTALFNDEFYIRDRVWTIVEGDNLWALTPGWAFVNRQGYILTDKPHDRYASTPSTDPIEAVYDLSDWPSELTWLEALGTKVHNGHDDGFHELTDEEYELQEKVDIARALIQYALLESRLFEQVDVAVNEDGAAYLKLALKVTQGRTPSFNSFDLSQRMATAVLNASFGDPHDKDARYQRFDRSAVSLEAMSPPHQDVTALCYKGKEVYRGFERHPGDPEGVTEANMLALARQFYYSDVGFTGVGLYVEGTKRTPGYQQEENLRPAAPAPAV